MKNRNLHIIGTITIVVVLFMALLSSIEEPQEPTLSDDWIDHSNLQAIDDLLAQRGLKELASDTTKGFYVSISRKDDKYHVLILEKDSDKKSLVVTQEIEDDVINREIQTVYFIHKNISYAIVIVNDEDLSNRATGISVSFYKGNPHSVDLFRHIPSRIFILSKDLASTEKDVDDSPLLLSNVKLLDENDRAIFNTDIYTSNFNSYSYRLEDMKKLTEPNKDYKWLGSFPNKQRAYKDTINDGYTNRLLIYEKGTYRAIEYVSNLDPIMNEDKTRIAYIDSKGFEVVGNAMIYDSTTSKIKTLTNYHYGRKEQTTAKVLQWLDNDRLLIISGMAYGTVTRGGDLYLYDLRTDEYKKILASEERTEYTGFTINEDTITMDLVRFDDNYDKFESESNEIKLSELGL